MVCEERFFTGCDFATTGFSFFDFFDFLPQDKTEKAPALLDEIVSSMGFLLYGPEYFNDNLRADLRNTVRRVAANAHTPFDIHARLANPTDLRVAATRFAEMKKLFVDLRNSEASIAVMTRNTAVHDLFARFRDTTLFAEIDAFFGIENHQDVAKYRVDGEWKDIEYSSLGMKYSLHKSSMLNGLVNESSEKPRFLEGISFDRVFLVDDDIFQCRGTPSLPETGGPGAAPKYAISLVLGRNEGIMSHRGSCR